MASLIKEINHMVSPVRARYSLKTRITLATLAIFLISLWALSVYASRMLRQDMERLLGEQQYSTASILANQVNSELELRLEALKNRAIYAEGPGRHAGHAGEQDGSADAVQRRTERL